VKCEHTTKQFLMLGEQGHAPLAAEFKRQLLRVGC